MSRSSFVRRAVAAAVVPLALASLTGCGHDDAARAKASSSTDNATPDTPAAGSTVAPADFADRFRDALDTITTAHATTKSEVLGTTISGAGDLDYRGDRPAAAMTMSGESFGADGLEVRIVDNSMYLNLGPITQGKFARMDLDAPGNPFGALTGGMDPSEALDALEPALQKVTYVGNDDTGDHYRATVDTAVMLKKMGQSQPAGAGVPTTMSYDAWFDHEGRLTRMLMDMGSLGTTETTLSDFGRHVDIEAPPAGQITTRGFRLAG